MGTLALVAGCSTAQRGEVSGVVRDRATGRVIAGARVVGADGSLAETDADGRFHLYVRGPQADVRVSATGHSSEHLEIAGLDTNVELAPIDTWPTLELAEGQSAHVVAFASGTWILDGGAHDASMARCTETSLAQAHSSIACANCHTETTRTRCDGCHTEEARVLRGASSAVIAPHDRIGDGSVDGGCLACHGERASIGDASRSCARCHGADAEMHRATLARAFTFAESTLDLASTTYALRSTIAADYDRTRLTTWARALARDRSGGAHDPRIAIAP